MIGPIFIILCLYLFYIASFEKFRNFIVSAGRILDEETAIIIKTKMASRVSVIESEEDAVMLLEDASRLPHATTVARIKTTCDLLVDGEFAQSGRSTLIRAFSTTTRKPKIIKFTDDAQKEYEVFRRLSLTCEDAVHYHLVPLEQYIVDEHGKTAVVMPMYSCTVDTPPNLTEDNVWEGLSEIVIGLQALHARDIVHNDIKPGNVLMDADGRWHICDYGSCTTTDTPREQRVDYTTMYIPRDFKTRRTKGFDYLLAVITALDAVSDKSSKFCSRDSFTLQDVQEQISTVEHAQLKGLLLSLFGQRNM